MRSRWSGPSTPINLELPKDLHVEMKTLAPRRGISLKEAYVQAATEWMESPEEMQDGVAIIVPRALADILRAVMGISINPLDRLDGVAWETIRRFAESYIERSQEQEQPRRKKSGTR